MGLGASSSLGFGNRYKRPNKFADYLAWVNKCQKDATTTIDWKPEWETFEDSINEVDIEDIFLDTLTVTLLTRLRTCEGLDLSLIRKACDENMVQRIIRGAKIGIDLNLAEFSQENETLKLVDPEGFLFSNYVISSILAEIDEN